MKRNILLDRAAALRLALDSDSLGYRYNMREILSSYNRAYFESTGMSELVRALSRGDHGCPLISIPSNVASSSEEPSLKESAARIALNPSVVKALAECDSSGATPPHELIDYVLHLLSTARTFDCDVLPCAKRTNLVLSLFLAAGRFGSVSGKGASLAFETGGGYPLAGSGLYQEDLPEEHTYRILLAEEDIDETLMAKLCGSSTISEQVSIEENASVGSCDHVPETGDNNVWYCRRSNKTVLVMVHGVLSDSRGCWLAEEGDPANPAYWPQIIAQDDRLAALSVFLGGYYTDLQSSEYGIRDCAEELYGALSRVSADGLKAPLQFDNIIFLGHSTGGIVVRYLIESHQTELRDKNVGLVLIASPSYGSRFANILGGITAFYRHTIGKELQWGHWTVKDLDSRFKELVARRGIRRLTGVEAYGNHFIFHRRFLPPIAQVVTAESAGRYFGAPVHLRDTDHFTCVKPISDKHPAHELLVDYYSGRFAPLVK